jgi:formylglycine-generating enzyme required for sulfatase activity/energy-coupling factor transporter ATP-binding protein EcfA2
MDAVNHTRPEVVIYKRKQTPYFDPDAPDYKEKQDQYEKLKTFLKEDPVFNDPHTGSARGIEYYDSTEDFRILIRTALQELTLAFLEKAEQAPQPPAPVPTTTGVVEIEASHWQGSPFPGLRSFQYEDAPIFFGRGREATAVIERLKHSRFVGVVGASGSGKSSLVMAGVLPRLRERNAIYTHQTTSEYWRVVQFTPSSHRKTIYHSPFEALYYALLEVFPQLVDNPLRAQRIKREFLEDVLKDPTTLAESCKYLLSEAPRGSEVLLFIDQFEELFTLSPESDRAPFAALLKSATQSEQMRVIVTMRSDFYQHCVAMPVLAELLQQGSFPLSTPTGGALYEMVRYPADRAALQFDEGLEQQILRDTGESAGALALLAYALDELYKISEARGDRRLTFADYEALQGVHGAIGQRAEAVFAQLTGDETDKQATLKTLFRALVSVNEDGTPTRQRITYEVAQADPLTRGMVTALIQARLLMQDATPTHTPTLEVAHEALFRHWARLKSWIDEAQEDLILLRQVRNAATEWDKRGRPNAFLWAQERLQLVYAMQARLHPDWNEVEQAFIEPEQERLYRELEIIETTHQRRYDIGERLARIGDYRKGIGVKEGIPDITWLPVAPGGEIDVERKTFKVQPFFIAKYLTTYAQFQAFINSGEYDDPRWWESFPSEYQPQQPRNVVNGNANAPRDTVSWYQSVAFMRWMTHRCRGLTLPNLIAPNDESWIVGENAEIRLPTEWEWQWAAQGGREQREYPWGEWRSGYANTTEAGINDRSTAVGMYPHGAAGCGALDMAGNLWEWCLNDHSKPSIINGYNNVESKVLRGGSFSSIQVLARSSSRYINDPVPNYASLNYGFRLVVAPSFATLNSGTLTSEL